MFNKKEEAEVVGVTPGKKMSKKKKALIIVGVVIFILYLIGNSASHSDDFKQGFETGSKAATESQPTPIPTEDTKTTPTPTEPTQPMEEEKKEPAEPIAPVSTLQKIKNNVKGVGNGKFEATVWTDKHDFATEQTPPPYEVIINAGNGEIASCKYAKISMFEIMKSLYGDPEIKEKISRVMFASWGHLRTSLGSEDGTKLDWSPMASGPTMYWDTMMQNFGKENETGPLSSRTWGVEIASDCRD